MGVYIGENSWRNVAEIIVSLALAELCSFFAVLLPSRLSWINNSIYKLSRICHVKGNSEKTSGLEMSYCWLAESPTATSFSNGIPAKKMGWLHSSIDASKGILKKLDYYS